jgi:hypothetical protein
MHDIELIKGFTQPQIMKKPLYNVTLILGETQNITSGYPQFKMGIKKYLPNSLNYRICIINIFYGDYLSFLWQGKLIFLVSVMENL